MQRWAGTVPHLVKAVDNVRDMRHHEAVYHRFEEHFREVLPVLTGVVFSALARPAWRVQIDAAGLVPD